MSPKSVALIAGAAAVMALAVYLFVQVRGGPAQAGAPVAVEVASHERITPTPAATTSDAAAATQPTSVSKPPPAPSASSDSQLRASNDVVPPPAMTGGDEPRANPKLDAMMEVANKAYDRGEFDEAAALAGKLLIKDPSNVRMLRIMVSANCIQGDAAIAQQYFDRLPKFDREQMKTRCDRYGVMFKEPSQ